MLRYTPQVGRTYRYEFTINRPHDPIKVTGEMEVLSEHEDGYQIQSSGTLGEELLSREMTISDRHNSSDPGYISLNFPDDPVTPGAEWSGEVPWYFENQYVAAKAHPHLEGADLVLTYAPNIVGYGRLVARDDLYYPRFLKASFKTAAGASTP